ncbi:MAG: DEAD/DEAH box helicase, partial [Nitrososphaerales archaeon]
MAICIATRSYSKDEVLSLLDPLVAEWFSIFPDLTPPQKYAIINIHEGKNTLIASPTGSGKTLSAFLSIINELVKLAREGNLEDRVYCVYISPLRSLNNDIYKNLMKPLNEIKEIAEKRGVKLQEIRVGVRTGDTTSSERAKMLHKPPHILITTPESIAIILCAPKFRENLKYVRWVIVDEIHEICSSKRGAHLTLSLERLEELCDKPFTRIGLSATIHPLEEVAKFLVGFKDGKERDCIIADTRFVKPTLLKVSSPVKDLIHASASYITSSMYRRIKDLIKKHKTTLIFTNTRSGTERVVYHLSKLNVVDGDELAAHHSSLSREIRKGVEDRLKEGKMKAVVTSTSLELG